MKEQRPLPKHYLWFAEEVNRSAGFLLQTTNGTLNTSALAVSIGLSLHAIELTGKAMLRSLGHLSKEIRKTHKEHKLLDLLADIERKISIHPDPGVREFSGFLLHAPTIDGQEFGSTIAGYLKKHFSQGKIAYSRNYLYPDNERFTSPRPISGIHVMADHLIEKAWDFAAVLGYETS